MKTFLRRSRLFCLSAFLLVPAPLPAQTQTPLVVGVAGMSAALTHPFIARDAGMFQKYGIDPRLVIFEGGSLLAQASLAGEVKISVTSGPVTIGSRSAGADTIVVAGYINTLPYNLVTAKHITSLEQLKGKKSPSAASAPPRTRRFGCCWKKSASIPRKT